MGGRDFTDAEMERYFSEAPNLNIAIVVSMVGILFVIFGLAVNPLHFIIVSLVGLPLLIMGGGYAVVVNRISKPTDKEYDEWLQKQVNDMIPEALRKLRLDERAISGQKLIVHSFVLPGTPDAARYPGEIRWKEGKDGVLRFSKNIYTFFFPAERFLAIFTTSIDALQQSTHIYMNATYYYKDIVSVESGNVHIIVDLDGEKTEYLIETFSLKIVNGGSIGIGAAFQATPVDGNQQTPTFTIPDSDIDGVVANLRMLIHSNQETSR